MAFGLHLRRYQPSPSFAGTMVLELETFHDQLNWSPHYSYLITSAYKTLALIRRHFCHSTSVFAKRLLYLTLIRSKLTYCSQVWRPFMLKDIILLQRVQRRATKFVLNDYHSDYKTRLTSLKLLPLMMVYEMLDITFFIMSLKIPTKSFDINGFIEFGIKI